MTWGYPRGRYRWCGERRPLPKRPQRRSVETDEGWLSFDVDPQPGRREGRRRLAFLAGHQISDDELDLRLADVERLRRSA